MTKAELQKMIRAEMELQGYCFDAPVVDALAHILATEGVDFGEVGVTAAVHGVAIGLADVLRKK